MLVNLVDLLLLQYNTYMCNWYAAARLPGWLPVKLQLLSPIATEERPPPAPQVNADGGTPSLSQETLSENFRDSDGPASHAQGHNCGMRPIDTLVTVGNNSNS